MRLLPLLSVLLALLASLLPAQDKVAEDPHAVVFLGLEEKGKGAPTKEGLRTFVILTDIRRSSPWYDAVTVLEKRGASRVVSFGQGGIGSAFKKLKAIKPGFVAVVLEPEKLDVGFHFDFLERASRLDRDPFVDFAFGYITGADAKEAAAFVKAIGKSSNRRLARSILEFGPSTRPSGLTGQVPHKWAKGFTTRRLAHENDATDVAQRISKIKNLGVLSAWGHGMPDGVANGLKGKQLRDSQVDLFPSLYFSGPCYCGVPSGWYGMQGGAIARKRVEKDRSFLLALIKARCTGIFAGLDPDRGETNHHELEHLLLTGEPLGMAAKSTYDEAVVAYRRKKLVLPRYVSGKPSPHRDIGDTMISGGACRAFFGDPRLKPIERAGEDPFKVTTSWTKRGLRVSWQGDEKLGRFWSPVDVYRANGGWTHRIRFRFDLPREKARELEGFKVVSVTKDGKDVPYLYATAAVELWGGKARVHGMVIFPPDHKNRILWGGRAYEARFLLTK
jgi:hypothetical protein